MENNLVCLVKDINGEYYCMKKDIDFFLYDKFNGLDGKVYEELTVEQVEKRHNGESCFILSEEQYGE